MALTNTIIIIKTVSIYIWTHSDAGRVENKHHCDPEWRLKEEQSPGDISFDEIASGNVCLSTFGI